MGKNIRAIRRATEATAYEVRRSTLTDEQRAVEDQAAADAATRHQAAQGLVIIGFVALFVFAWIAMAIGTTAAIVLTGVIAAGIFIYYYLAEEKKARAEADAARAERSVARARREAAAARAAQREYHVRMLRDTDPVFMALAEQWQQIPISRPDDRRRNEALQANRMVVIDDLADRFAELERTGQPVPDHALAMQDLVAAEQAWDARV